MKLLPVVSLLAAVLAFPLTTFGQFGPPHGPHGFHPAPPPPRPSFGISVGVRAPAPVVAPYVTPGVIVAPPPVYPVYNIDSRYPSEWQTGLDPYGYRMTRSLSSAHEGDINLMRPLDMNANRLLFQAVRGIPDVQYTPLSASYALIPGGAQYWFIAIAYPRNVMGRPYYVCIQAVQGPQYPYGFQLMSIDPVAYTDPNGYYVSSPAGSESEENVSSTIPTTTFDGPADSISEPVASGSTATPAANPAANAAANPYGESNPYANGYIQSNGANATGTVLPAGTPTPAEPSLAPQTKASRAVQSVLENADEASAASGKTAEPAEPIELSDPVSGPPLDSDELIQLTPPAGN